MSKKMEAQLEELTSAVAELVIALAPRAKAQAPLATEVAKAGKKKTKSSYWAGKSGITNSEAIGNLDTSTKGAERRTVTIDDEVVKVIIGKVYSNKVGTKCRAMLAENRGGATVRLTKAGQLPKAAKVYFGDEVAEVTFSA